MKILVGVKRVIDYNVRVQINRDGTGVVTDGVKMSINPFDEIAVEEALRLREAGVAEEVIAVSIGPATAQQQLRTALAMGADRAILVETDERSAAAGRGARVPEADRARKSPGLVMLGKQAIDDDANQTGQMLAALWDRPQATFVSGSRTCRRQGHRGARSRRRSGDHRGRPAGRLHRRPASQRTALRQDAGHHEGQTQAAGDRRPLPISVSRRRR